MFFLEVFAYQCRKDSAAMNLIDVLIDLLFYGSSTLLRSFRARSVNLSTLFLDRLSKRLTSTEK